MYYKLKDTIYFFNESALVVFNWVISENGFIFSGHKQTPEDFAKYKDFISLHSKPKTKELTEDDFLLFETLLTKVIQNAASLKPITDLDKHLKIVINRFEIQPKKEIIKKSEDE